MVICFRLDCVVCMRLSVILILNKDLMFFNFEVISVVLVVSLLFGV